MADLVLGWVVSGPQIFFLLCVEFNCGHFKPFPINNSQNEVFRSKNEDIFSDFGACGQKRPMLTFDPYPRGRNEVLKNKWTL